MYRYLYLIPFSIIYSLLFFIIVPRTEGKTAKLITMLGLIPVAFFLTSYVDQYLPRWLYLFSRILDF